MEPYERLLGDALRGDGTLVGSEAGVEAAWRIVDPVLNTDGPLHEYDRGSWGPAEAEEIAANIGGWIKATCSSRVALSASAGCARPAAGRA